MNKQEIMKDQAEIIHLLNDMLKSQVDSYRLLIASAAELNNIYEARSSQVKVVIKRAEAVGKIIDELTELIEKCAMPYFEYCKIKGKYIHDHTNDSDIFTEVDDELSFQNSSVTRSTLEVHYSDDD